ncbi:hypothetical protein AVEN_157745-1, partial [Araneus ventricosus]
LNPASSENVRGKNELHSNMPTVNFDTHEQPTANTGKGRKPPRPINHSLPVTKESLERLWNKPWSADLILHVRCRFAGNDELHANMS